MVLERAKTELIHLNYLQSLALKNIYLNEYFFYDDPLFLK